MCAVEINAILGFDDFLEQCWNSSHLLYGSLICDTKLKDNPSPLHLLEVMNPGVGQITVGKDQLLPGERLDPGGFNPDFFHNTILIPDHQKVTHLKRSVEKNHKIIE